MFSLAEFNSTPETLDEEVHIDYPGYGQFTIKATSPMIRWRGETFLTKEPTTLKWLQSLNSESYLIDVGANIGIYTLPSALFHVKHVISVEPELRNYIELTKNIEANRISSGSVTALQLAISTQLKGKSSKIYLTKDIPGFSCHQVGANQDFRLNPTTSKKRITRDVFCISLEELIKVSNIPSNAPINIKIDVDGLEADVCESLFTSCLIHRISSIQIELNPNIKQHANLINKLHNAGFIFSEGQIRKSRRQEGEFKGFAEYVFIPSIRPDIISNSPLSKSIIDQHETLYAWLDSFESVSLTSLNQYSKSIKEAQNITFVDYSTIPAAGVIKGLLSKEFCLNASKLVIDASTQSNKDFTYPSTLKGPQTNSQRMQVANDKISSIDKNYIDHLIRVFTNKEFISNLVRFPKSICQFSSKKNNHRFIESNPGTILYCRIRHFLDFKGFYLTNHHDSSDTLFAIVLPLLGYATSTSIINRIENQRYINSKVYDPAICHKSSFNSNQAALVDNDIYVELTPNYQNRGLYYRINQIKLKPGEASIIVNIRCPLLDLEPVYRNITSQESGHLVYPPLNDLYRPVLLVDYCLCSKSEFPSLRNDSINDATLVPIVEAKDILSSFTLSS